MHIHRLLTRRQAAVVVGLALSATRALSADLQVTLPTLSAPPGATVVVHLDASPGPNGLGIVAMDFALPLDPAIIQSSSIALDGFLQFWGPPFLNATNTLAAGAAAGLTPVSSSRTRMVSVFLTLRATAVPGSTMPLAFTTLRFNEGNPSVSVTPGSLAVSSALGAPLTSPNANLMLSAPHPNPARGLLHATLTLAETGPTWVTLHDVSGRQVCTLANGALGAGPHEFTWDGHDSSGHMQPAGLYLLRAAHAGEVRVQRVVWMR